MESLFYLLLETLILGLTIVGLHASKKHFGIGLLFIFLGTVQFFQTLLSSNVYNLYLDVFMFSPGSALIYTSTLFAILLIFRSESLIKVRSVIYGIIISNIILVFLSYISLEQILTDSYSRNATFLTEVFDFDISLFITGTALLYMDMILILFLYRYIESKFESNYFLQFFIATALTSILDSFLFYTLNFYTEVNYFELLIGNIVGKVFVCFALSVIFAIHVKLNPNKSNKRKALSDVFMIIDFTNGNR